MLGVGCPDAGGQRSRSSMTPENREPSTCPTVRQRLRRIYSVSEKNLQMVCKPPQLNWSLNGLDIRFSHLAGGRVHEFVELLKVRGINVRDRAEFHFAFSPINPLEISPGAFAQRCVSFSCGPDENID